MNFNNQHPSDEIIERELQGLREPVTSAYGIGDAVKAMQSMPVVKRRPSLNWPVGIGSVVVGIGAVVLVGSLTTSKAYAGDLREIASAQEHQKTMYMKSYIFGGKKDPQMVTDFWLDHNKEAFYQYRADGKLEAVNVADGKTRFSYFLGNEQVGLKPNASLDVDHSEHRTIETITEYIQSDFFRKRSIEKTTGVKLNGRSCDLYNFAKGYYRIWVDPMTKLPIQREVYDKGITLWERDVYEYPASFSQKTFAAPTIPGVPYYNYVVGRSQLQQKLDQPGESQKVGNVTITLKAVVKGSRDIQAIWSTTGVDGWSNSASSSVEVVGVRKSYSSVRDMSAVTFAPGHSVLNEHVILEDANSLTLPAKIRIAAWESDPSHPGTDGKPGKKLVGWATFTVKNLMTVPYIEQLLHHQMGGAAVAATAKDSQ